MEIKLKKLTLEMLANSGKQSSAWQTLQLKGNIPPAGKLEKTEDISGLWVNNNAK